MMKRFSSILFTLVIFAVAFGQEDQSEKSEEKPKEASKGVLISELGTNQQVTPIFGPGIDENSFPMPSSSNISKQRFGFSPVYHRQVQPQHGDFASGLMMLSFNRYENREYRKLKKLEKADKLRTSSTSSKPR